MSDAESIRKQRMEAMEEKRKRLDSLRHSRKQVKPTDVHDGSIQLNTSEVEKKLTDCSGCDDIVEQLLNSNERSLITTQKIKSMKQLTLEDNEGKDSSSNQLLEEVTTEISKDIPETVDTYDKDVQTDFEIPADSRLDHLDVSEKLNIEEAITAAAGSTENQSTTKQSLTQAEKEAIIRSTSFQIFVKQSSTLVERALNEASTFDILSDYSRASTTERQKDVEKLIEALNIIDLSLTNERSVTDVHWSPHYPELILVSFSACGKGQALNSALFSSSVELNDVPDGLVLVYSLAVPSRPEFKLITQSAVLTARFHEYDENLIIGGCYSGQVVTWDLRSSSHPIQQTKANQFTHSHPVYSLSIEGSAVTHSLVTASTDGRIMWWNPTQLSQHIEVMNINATGTLQNPEISPSVELTVSCITCIPGSDTLTLLAGTEKGEVIVSSVHGRGGGSTNYLNGHYGMVTALDTHPSYSKSLQGLVLSCSVDWTTKLWNPSHSKEPLMSFPNECYDYICDVRWSPCHPALFATANVAGEISLWNLNISVDVPVIPALKVRGGNALTRLCWSRKGRRLLVGDISGAIYVYSIADDIAYPRPDEEQRLERLLQECYSAQ